MTKDGSVMYSSEKIERTLNKDFLTEPVRNSRKTELGLLQKEIDLTYQKFKTPLKILDIGVGDGFIPTNLDKESWVKIENYTGIDNSITEVQNCQNKISEAGLSQKVKIFEWDATRLNDFKNNLSLPLHLIVCTYFTPGNFKPNEISTGTKDELNPNKKFQNVFSESYDLLCGGGKLILGSVYMDSEETRMKQEEFYRNCGMTVITNEKDEFTATKEGFWSERFTEEKIYRYLNWINPQNIQLISLDNENFAKMVIITKP